MTAAQLLDFVRHRMQMSHVYQPVMLLALLEHGGTATDEEIARALLLEDRSQLEYYIKIVRKMPGPVLRRRGVVRRDQRTYHLEGYGALSPAERDELANACRAARDDYIAKRGARPWAHRAPASGYISGTVQYEVLKAAKLHCELCCIPNHEKALQVDHIVPRAKGRSDDPSNLQALCYSCNARKRDRDDTDFRAVRAAYEHREPGCVSCDVPVERVVAENPLAVVIRDK